MFRLQERYKKIGTSQVFDGLNRYQMRMGDDGGDSTPQPTAPSAPSYGSTIQDYIKNYPDLFELLKKYAPQEAALQQGINQQLYPKTAALQENLSGIAQQGMDTGAPDWYTQQTQDTLKSQFGRNLVFNPRAQEQYGVATQQAAEDWKRYYQNMGMALSGKQPLASYTNNITSQYAPSQATQFAAQNYGTGANIYGTQGGMYGNQLSYNLGMQQYSPANQMWNLAGSIGGGVAGAATSKWMRGY